MLVDVATRDTYITRATIRNRFIELILNKIFNLKLVKVFCNWKIIEYYI